MKLNLTTGCLFLLGLPALAIESPGNSNPIPPQISPGESPRSAVPATPVAPGAPAKSLAAPDPDDSETDTVVPSSPLGRDDSDDDGLSDVAPAAGGAYLGVGGAEVPDILAEHLKLSSGQGMVIRSLDPDSPAAKAGLATNDIITKIDGHNIGSHEELREVMRDHKAGDEVSVDFIDHGDAKNVRVTLEPARASGAVASRRNPLERLRFEGMTPDQASRIQDAVERNLRAFENADRDIAAQTDAMEQMQRSLQDRIQRMMGASGGIELRGNFGGGAPNANGRNFRSTSKIQLLDEKGSIELRSEDGSKKVRALNKDGSVQWEGPYNNDEDKKAMPEDVRERVEKLAPDMDFQGNGFRLNIGPRR